MFNFVVDVIHIFRKQYLERESPWLSPFFMELLFWLALIPAVLFFWKWQPRWMERLEGGFVRISRRKAASVLFVALLALALRLAVLPIKPVPVPSVHDEFSYLMQAQTFNSGRLTNPPHPMWVHFETYHVNMQPTYQAMYPPGQAAFLALGLRFAGDPWFGVMLGIVLMCAAITWMLQGWMPPQWALLGGIFCVLRFAVFGRWVDTYYGGGLAALGGALVLGAVPRIRRGQNAVLSALLFATGLALLANTRQYEGFMLSLVPLGWLAHWLVTAGKRDRRLALKVVAAGLLVLVPVSAFMLYYNYRGTGHALTMPYVINQQTYHVTKPFLWQDQYPTPEYRHFEMKKFYLFHELPDYLRSRHLWGLEEVLALKARIYYGAFLWPLLIAGVFAMWFALKSRKLRMLPVVGLVLVAALAVVIWQPEAQYPAPGMAILIAIMVLCIRLARTVRIGDRSFGLGLARAMCAGVLALLLGSIAYALWNPDSLDHYSLRIPPGLERARIVSELESTPGKHVVIVRRSYFSWPGFEWVYNDADIDASRIVWARDMGDELNQELANYYKDRKIWLLHADDRKLSAYRPSVPNADQIVSAQHLITPAQAKTR